MRWVTVKAAGWRIEPPVSVAGAPMQSSAATADAEPPDEPPGTSVGLEPSRRHGFPTGPKHEVSFDEPIANSPLLGLPGITPPSRQSWWVAGQRCKIGHLWIGLQKNGDRVLSLAGSSFFEAAFAAASISWSTALTATLGSAALPCRSILSR